MRSCRSEGVRIRNAMRTPSERIPTIGPVKTADAFSCARIHHGVDARKRMMQKTKGRSEASALKRNMVEPRGIEPLTSWLPAMRSPS